eukprot:CAMPEP_0202699552 /NCGR_PEP_ID=MMETSP1385-20130828/12785_1 /ASSEMBLY_ACC=CAM_ASM_000861 /TAXON_ID=933848 /ORGANISM="Elphidium margaritaceum" /LENGTH=347 /DNA_ID=CAMNT_0049356527 /DNA_START=30 /DNA_END=1070 /DNA_ORIENTATION=-
MDANRGEAERCLREAEKWQRQDRPVRALKFAKKSHHLYPTTASQSKVSELCTLLRARGFTDIGALLRDHPPASDINDHVPPPPPLPQNQPFVELDPNALHSNNMRNHNNNGTDSNVQRMFSIDFWCDSLERVFGPIFASIHSKLSPVLPPTLANFTLRHRPKVWLLLLLTICLLFTRFAIIGHSFGANNSFKSIPTSSSPAAAAHGERSDERYAPSVEQRRREYEKKYHNREHSYDERSHSKDYNKQRRRNMPPQHSHFDHRDRETGHGYSFDFFSPYNLMTMLFFGSILLSMFGNQRNGENGNNANANGNGFNWNMMLLPMMFGGGFGGGFGARRYGGGGFGARRR